MATESRTPSAEPTSGATPSGARTPASSTKWTTGCSASRPITCASRVLPSPPAPTIEVTRDERMVSASAATSWSRPISRDASKCSALAHRAVPDQQLGVQPLERRTRVGAEPVAHLLAVPLVAVQRSRGPAHGRLAGQQRHEQCLVVRILGHGGLEQLERLGMAAEAGQGAAEDQPGLGDVAARLAAYVLERAVGGAATHRRRDDGGRLVRARARSPDVSAARAARRCARTTSASTDSSGTPSR